MKRVLTIIGLGILAVTMFVAAPARALEIFTVTAPTPSCVAPPSDIVAWWPGEGAANDIIGGNNGVLVGGIGFAGGEVGEAFSLNNSNAYVSVPVSSSLDVGSGSGFTLEAWINPTDVTQEGPIFEWNNDVWWGVHFHVSNGQVTTGSAGPNGPGQLYANIVDSNGTWHQLGTAAGVVTGNGFQHVALTYDQASGVATIYCNGQIVSQASMGSFTPQTAAPYHLNLGRRQASGDTTNNFAGRIDEPSVYNRALASNEIAAIYNAGSAGKCAPQCVPPPSGLVAWWQAESNAADIFGGNNGTPTAGVTYEAGEVGAAFNLDGGNYVDVNPAASSLDVGQGPGFTMEAWINPTTLQRPMPIIEYERVLGSSDAHDDGMLFFISIAPDSGTGPGCIVANVEDKTFTSHIITTAPNLLVANTWQHVALTYNRSSGVGTIYLNGNVVTQQNLGSFVPETSFQNFLIGGRTEYGSASSPSEYFSGGIDELSVYGRDLTLAEIQSIYHAGAAGKCPGSLPPVIISPPASQTVIEGGEADLSVTAAGAGPLSYQWIFNGKNIAGATGTALSLPNIHPNQAGNYSVKVTGANGSVTSSPAVVTVIKQNILIYNYSGNESITTLGNETSYGFSGQLFFIPDTTNATFVGWATINKKKVYWVSQVSDYLWIRVAGSSGHMYTVLGKAGTLFDGNGRPNIWSFFHKGLNANLPIATGKTFSFPNSFVFSDTQVYPDTQTGNMILREASSNYSFVQNSTQTANNTGQTVNDLVAALVKSLVKQGYQPQ
ncbi:MAG TPA: LamG-like jellyroll fold domain-containing protein [Candidatus Acidoferrales bacterium]|jgi:hypothetical protein|nr:LamG-like jellyroll fold domain-containing protein [Candidatus Acidoferrales bacterium]